MEGSKEATVDRILSLVQDDESTTPQEQSAVGVTGRAKDAPTVTHNGKTYPLASFAGTIAGYPATLDFLKTDANIALAERIDQQTEVAQTLMEAVQRAEIALTRNEGHPRFLRAFFEANVAAQTALTELDQRKVDAQLGLLAAFEANNVPAASEEEVASEVRAFESERRRYLLITRDRIAASMGITGEQLDELSREAAADAGVEFHSPADFGDPSKLN